ncbi:MAG: glycosyltransferase [Planctomycetota bacterium]
MAISTLTPPSTVPQSTALDHELISVIITTHNRAHLLQRAISSVLNQTHQNFELIVVDDGSTDATPSVISAVRDPRLVYLRRTTSSNYASAPRNQALKIARAEYIAYLDDDDEFLPEHLRRLLRALAATKDAEVAYCDREYRSNEGLGEEVAHDSFPFDREALMRNNGIQSGDILHTKAAAFRIGGWNSELRRNGSWDFVTRLARSGSQFVHVPEVLTRYHYHSGQLLWNRQASQMEGDVASHPLFMMGDDALVATNNSNAKTQATPQTTPETVPPAVTSERSFAELTADNFQRFASMLQLSSKTILEVGLFDDPGGQACSLAFDGNFVRTMDVDPNRQADWTGELSQAGFRPETWDMIVLNGVLESTPHYIGLLEEAYRALKPGGLILMHTRFADRLKQNDVVDEYWRFAPITCWVMLENFEVAEVAGFGGSPDRPVLVSSLARKPIYGPLEATPCEPVGAIDDSYWNTKLLAAPHTVSQLSPVAVNNALSNLPSDTRSVLSVGLPGTTHAEQLQRSGIHNVIVGTTAKETGEARQAGFEAYHFDIHNLPFRDGEFDFVTCGNVFERSLAPCIALQELSRITRRGVVLVLSTQTGDEAPSSGTAQFLRSLLASLAQNAQLELAEEWKLLAGHHGFLLHKVKPGFQSQTTNRTTS